MTFDDWTDALYEELAKQAARQGALQLSAKPHPDGHGCFRIDLGQYGIQVMPDEDEVILWLLDHTGKTSGPIWCEGMTPETIASAAEAISRSTATAPGSDCFQAWPPIGRDITAENAVNDLWENVQAKIDTIEPASLDRAGVTQTIQNIHDYIDALMRAEENAALVQYAPVFKHQATDIIRKGTGGNA